MYQQSGCRDFGEWALVYQPTGGSQRILNSNN
jgi:hypothetical protein